jgi:hypothetical protein
VLCRIGGRRWLSGRSLATRFRVSLQSQAYACCEVRASEKDGDRRADRPPRAINVRALVLPLSSLLQASSPAKPAASSQSPTHMGQQGVE